MKILVFLLAPLALLLHTGCVGGYTLGSTLPSHIKSVYVPIAQNSTEEPLLQNEVTRAALAQLQRDGSLQIETEDRADAILNITITEFALRPLAYDNANRLRPNEYRLVLKATAELVQKSDGKVLVRTGNLEGRSDFELTGDLTTGKRRATPDAAEDLGRRISAAVTEAWTD
jgi:outer membrane lipopolysaccharide assembly protein LptE/RlpB